MRVISFIIGFGILICSCENKISYPVEKGVSREMAVKRKDRISFLSYELKFSIPDQKEEHIIGSEKIGVKLTSADDPLILDFKVSIEDPIGKLKVNGSDGNFEINNGHIIIGNSNLKVGYNEIGIDFTVGDQSLNRNHDFLYTLFVPDRASTAFPCFDQPDLKARYQLQLEIPAEWSAMSNGPIKSEKSTNNVKTVVFEESDLVSTYLFSFVAGKFQSVTKEIEGLEMTMFHRETDVDKVVRNTDEIFRQHYDALKWLEEYTDIKYPFKKFDFALIPSFQYNGMEHTGAIEYRASSMLLEGSATIGDKISRSMLIAHETAHMWFGNLVTIKWFDDVWMKEVFANFMASKITEPNFPGINHNLNFLFNHYPESYAVDRTEGANSIKQELGNLKNAGTMYGAIIYHKAPIVMRQLELMIGESAFREALREYLQNFSERNASWSDLVDILDIKSEKDIKKWSKVWIEEPGMPFIDIEFIDAGEERKFDIVQYDLDGKNRVWPQKFDITFAYGDGNVKYSIASDDRYFSIRKSEGTAMPLFIQMNSDGLGYGIFANGLDYNKKELLFNRGLVDIPSIAENLDRGAAYLMLHEYLLHEGMNPVLYFKYLEDYISAEQNELILTYLLDNLELVYWKFLTDEEKRQYAPEVESMLTQKIAATVGSTMKHLLLKKYIGLAQTERGIKNLMNFWSGASVPVGVELSEDELILLTYNIELKSGQITNVLADQIDRLDNPDRKAELQFVAQALDQDDAKREKFFKSLLDPANREREAWVNKALYYLNHPIRSHTSIRFLEEALNELPEIQATGDIFFPKRWLDNALWGHNSKEAVRIINKFLKDHNDLDPKLKQKVLQSADMVFRAERIIYENSSGS